MCPQSSLVVSFSPAPSGEDGRSDLLSIVRRFGLPLYTLFLPSKVSVDRSGFQNQTEPVLHP